jgi:hypothetical protein
VVQHEPPEKDEVGLRQAIEKLGPNVVEAPQSVEGVIGAGDAIARERRAAAVHQPAFTEIPRVVKPHDEILVIAL